MQLVRQLQQLLLLQEQTTVTSQQRITSLLRSSWLKEQLTVQSIGMEQLARLFVRQRVSL
jgi:hypothetical protein